MMNATDPATMTGQDVPPIFFLHGPKAGGTALKSRFDRAFAPDEISPTIEVIPSERDPSAWSSFAGFKFASGHCGYEVYRALGAKHLLVTNFRLPIDRIVSLYDYWRNNFPKHDSRHNYPVLNASKFAKQLSFAEFIRSDEPAVKLYVRNAHSRQLLKSAWVYSEPHFFDMMTLKWRIRHMHWFYICEKAELSEIWFRHQFPAIPVIPLAIENATNYSESAKTIPTAEDIALLEEYNAYDLAIYKYASELLKRRVGDITGSSPGLFGHRRIISGLRFIKRLPRTIAQIERRLEAIENGGRHEAPNPSPPPPVAAAAEPVSETPAAAPAPDPANLRYLAYAEQIPRGPRIYIVGQDTMAAWTLRLLRSRGYAVEAFIADTPDAPENHLGLPVVERAGALKTLARDDVVVVASPHRDSLVREFADSDNLFDATALYQFATEFCDKDPNGVLLDDLAISYWRTTPAQAEQYGDVWRRLKKQSPAGYVRSIEAAAGPGSRFAVNVGGRDAAAADPCRPLLDDGWTGRTIRDPVTPANIGPLLADNGVPQDCDLIRVNTERYDGAVVQAILEGGWRPRVFCLEINADIPPPFLFAVTFDEAEQAGAAGRRTPRDVGLFSCSAGWAAALLTKHGYDFAQYEFGFPKAIGQGHAMVFIRDDVFGASQATAGIAWDQAYYAEPLAWSPIKSGLKIDVRNWRHAQNPEEQAAAIAAELRDRTKKFLGSEISFMLDV